MRPGVWWAGLASLLSLYSLSSETGGVKISTFPHNPANDCWMKRWPITFTRDYDVLFVVPVISETPGRSFHSLSRNPVA